MREEHTSTDLKRERSRISDAEREGVTAPLSTQHSALSTRNERLLALLSPLVLLVLWEIASRSGLLNAVFFPPPSAILGALKRLILSGDLPRDVLATSRRVAIGFLLGFIPAAAVGLLMGLSGTLRAVLLPI